MVDRYRQLAQIMTQEQARERVAPFRSDFKNATNKFVRSMFPDSADRSLVERIVADVSSAPVRVAVSSLEAVWSNTRDDLASLSQLNLPVVAINPANPPTDVESMNRYGVQVALIPGVGHFPMLEDPPTFNECLLKVAQGFPE